MIKGIIIILLIIVPTLALLNMGICFLNGVNTQEAEIFRLQQENAELCLQLEHCIKQLGPFYEPYPDK